MQFLLILPLVKEKNENLGGQEILLKNIYGWLPCLLCGGIGFFHGSKNNMFS
jgi:hypothetical protein